MILRSLLFTLLVVTPAAAAPPAIHYTRDILPILSDRCFRCHGPDEKERRGELRLDARAEALRPAQSGEKAVVPRDSGRSELVRRIFAAERNQMMPPPASKKKLSDAEKQLLKRWIEEGASYEQHWAFVKPRRSSLPAIQNRAWPRNGIDHFVHARLEKEGLQPSAEADRYSLARRAALDLTGLPPTLEEVERFVNDRSGDAFEKYVDQQLAKPAYGEHWASLWMDLGRYADSNGYAQDGPRTIWPWRDWLIRAINRNLPFDQFTIDQFAGDMLPNPTLDQIVATGFHRNTLTNEEGGTNDEEFRVAAVVDRVNTTFQVWMGLTMGCAQCHTHKYDPITHEEYYRVFALLNQSEDADRGDNSPFLTLSTPQDQARKKELSERIATLEKQLKAQDSKPVRDQVAALKKELAQVPNVTTPIMRELPPNQRRKTNILLRGNFLDKGVEVQPGVPAVLPPLGGAKPQAAFNRLDFARWVVSVENPLTARVIVNRYWDQLFGLGLVETVEDFGVRGKAPSHPELLDWLASEFVAQGWDVKHLLKSIVTSATYRQSSRVTPALLERDPGNRLLARGPRFRASAEVIRDQALHIAGLLSAKQYGPSVRPPRPKLGLNAAFGGSTDWEPSPGEDRYRRGLYTTIRRTAPFPSMTTFDAPDRNFCTLLRPKTNTPLQALVTLNDPVYVEAAQALARRVLKENSGSTEARLTHAFRLCLTRPPRPEELRKLVELHGKARQRYAADLKAAAQLATEPIGPAPKDVDLADLAAWTLIGNVLLNLDEVVARR